MGISTDIVEVLIKHSNSKSFQSSVRAFLRQFGITKDIDNWEEEAVIAAAFLKGVKNSLRNDRKCINDVTDRIL